MDFMILFLDSVGQEESFGIICLFVCSVTFPVAVNHCTARMHGSPPAFSNERANGHQSTYNITTKFLSTEEHFVFGIGMLLLLPGPLLTQHSGQPVSEREQSLGERTMEMNERERKRGIRLVCSC